MRQPERRLFFHHIFAQMPLWETWTTDKPIGDGTTITIAHCKAIPRRLRRSMARVRAKREWQAAHGGGA